MRQSKNQDPRASARSQRQLRVGEELRHALARILAQGGFRDPVLADSDITVTEVRVSPDLKNATAFVVPLGGAGLEGLVAALNRARGYFRSRLGREIQLRHTPQIEFAADRSFDASDHIESLLRRPKVQRDLAKDDPGELDTATD